MIHGWRIVSSASELSGANATLPPTRLRWRTTAVLAPVQPDIFTLHFKDQINNAIRLHEAGIYFPIVRSYILRPEEGPCGKNAPDRLVAMSKFYGEQLY
jgi:hypothetical protein